MTPTLRKPVGIIALLLFMGAWSVMIASASEWLATLPQWVQAIAYTVAGTIWIVPLGPLLRWMETGSWRKNA